MQPNLTPPSKSSQAVDSKPTTKQLYPEEKTAGSPIGDQIQSSRHLQPKSCADEAEDPNLSSEQAEEESKELVLVSPSRKSQSQSRKDRVRSLFLRYAELTSETGILAMKSRQCNKLLADSGIFDITPKFNRVKADIIYSSHAKNIKGSISFDTFLNCLVGISEIVYPDLAKQKRSKAFDKLISAKLLPFYDQICSGNATSSFSQPNTSIAPAVQEIVYDVNVKDILSSAFTGLKDIYDCYFSELARADPEYLAEAASRDLITFLKDFGLLGQFVQKQAALVMLDQLVNTADEKLTNSEEVLAVFGDVPQDYGYHFTLARFFVFLSWIGIIGFDANKPEPEQYSSAEKVYFLLAKMELSEAFAAMYGRSAGKTMPTLPNLIPPPEITARIIINNPLDIRPRRVKNLSSSKKSALAQYTVESMGSVVIPEEEKQGVEACTDKLQQIFMWYCSFSESANENKMPLSKFVLFVKDAGVLLDASETSDKLKGMEFPLITL